MSGRRPARSLTARDVLAIAVARGIAWTVRRGGRGGTSLPGLIATRLSPGVDARAARLLAGAVLVSGTNGKTATSKLLATILRASGYTVIANASGANLRQSVATVLIGAISLRGRLRHARTVAVLEVDEAALPGIRAWLPADVMVMTNLFRDQLDRFGETDHLIRLWTAMLASDREAGTLVYCADDPRLAALVAVGGGSLRAYGMDGPPPVRATAALTRELATCPVCGGPLAMTWTGTAHLGDYRCDRCGFDRPALDLAVAPVARRGLDGETLRFRWGGAETETVELALPGLGNTYNAAAAVSAAVALGIEPRSAIRALAAATTPFARFETLSMDGRRVVLSLLKNPAGMGEVSDIAAGSPVDTVLVAVNNAHADGRDVSWYWDCSPAALLEDRRFVVSGSRCLDFLLRARYAIQDDPAGDPPGFVDTVPDPVAGLDRAVAVTPAGGMVLVVATYTALLGIRAALVDRSLLPAMPR